MSWVYHDSFKTKKAAAKAGDDIVKIGLASGVKINKLGKKARPYLLYIVPFKTKGVRKS
jgi:hypothetical protein